VGVDARGDVDGRVNGAPSGQLTRPRGRIPREKAERSARATGFRFGEEPRPGGSHHVVARRLGREVSDATKAGPVTGDPKVDAGKSNDPQRLQHGRYTVLVVRRDGATVLEGQVNLMEASITGT